MPSKILACFGIKMRNKTKQKNEPKSFIRFLKQDNIWEIQRIILNQNEAKFFNSMQDSYKGEECYPLHIACARGSVNAVKLFLHHGANVEWNTFSGMTPLHFAAAFNKRHLEVTQLLIDSGAFIDSTESKNGFTALHFAVQNDNMGAARILCKSTCQRDIKDLKGITAKQMAIDLNNKAIITLLLECYDEQVVKEENKRLYVNLMFRISEFHNVNSLQILPYM
jgi:ankyrin repeat protein